MRPTVVDVAHQGLLREPLSLGLASKNSDVITPLATESIEKTFDGRDVPAGMKRCRSCAQVLPFDRFYKRSGGSGRRADCKSCTSDQALERYHADPRAARDRHLRRAFGISADEYDALLQQQGGGCALCGAEPDSQANALHVDHDHLTGERRAILCHGCNVGLGRFHDSPALLERAAIYVGSYR